MCSSDLASPLCRGVLRQSGDAGKCPGQEVGLWAEVSFLEALGGGLGLSTLLQAGQVPGRGAGVWRARGTRLRGFCVVAGIPHHQAHFPRGRGAEGPVSLPPLAGCSQGQGSTQCSCPR